MGKTVEEMVLVGFHHFSSKDKTKIYYVIQCLHNDVDIERSNNKGTLINIFVTEEVYKQIIHRSIGELLKVEISANLQTSKVSYRVVI